MPILSISENCETVNSLSIWVIVSIFKPSFKLGFSNVRAAVLQCLTFNILGVSGRQSAKKAIRIFHLGLREHELEIIICVSTAAVFVSILFVLGFLDLIA